MTEPPPCPVCGRRQWPVTHSCRGPIPPPNPLLMATVDGLPAVPLNDPPRCWSMADDEDPDCPIGSARCVRPDGHDGEHMFEGGDADTDFDDEIANLCGHHSWAGLMALLDEHWPEDIFPTRYDDPARDAGPRIVSLIRWVDRLRGEANA